MPLLASVSGIRGTIGGLSETNLTPKSIVDFTSAYAAFLRKQTTQPSVVIGRDGRISGPMVHAIVQNTLLAMGCNVLDMGLATTPGLEMAIPAEKATGGIMITASHNPGNWNALKLLNAHGEFISAKDGNEVLHIASSGNIDFADAYSQGKYFWIGDYNDYHVKSILELPYVDIEAIKGRGFSVVVDAINSTGALAIPVLLSALGVEYVVINQAVNGHFAHDPEPLPQHLTALSEAVKNHRADLGIVVDPDVDRLAFIDEYGNWVGEEYTIVMAADCILDQKPGPVVSNLSSSRALADLAKMYDQHRYTSAVGEVHVVEKMKITGAVIGGEGNGGVILPELHYGRDAMLGIALVLSHLARQHLSISSLRSRYQDYAMAKLKADLPGPEAWSSVLSSIKLKYNNATFDTIDGLKGDLPGGWFHLRKSNTEPIIRIYTEMPSENQAIALGEEIRDHIAAICKAVPFQNNL